MYCVVPEALADELYPRLVEHYADEPNMTVIVDRRKADRRGGGGGTTDPDVLQRRVVRDRRRARVAGEMLPLARP